MNKITVLIELILWLSIPFWIRPALRSFGVSEETIRWFWEGSKFTVVAVFLFVLLVTIIVVIAH